MVLYVSVFIIIVGLVCVCPVVLELLLLVYSLLVPNSVRTKRDGDAKRCELMRVFTLSVLRPYSLSFAHFSCFLFFFSFSSSFVPSFCPFCCSFSFSLVNLDLQSVRAVKEQSESDTFVSPLAQSFVHLSPALLLRLFLSNERMACIEVGCLAAVHVYSALEDVHCRERQTLASRRRRRKRRRRCAL